MSDNVVSDRISDEVRLKNLGASYAKLRSEATGNSSEGEKVANAAVRLAEIISKIKSKTATEEELAYYASVSRDKPRE